MKLDEAIRIMKSDAQQGRTRIDVRQDGDEYVTEYEGVVYRACNPIGLDSKLSDGGVPAPRSLFLIDEGGDDHE